MDAVVSLRQAVEQDLCHSCNIRSQLQHQKIRVALQAAELTILNRPGSLDRLLIGQLSTLLVSRPNSQCSTPISFAPR
jgi:hypothetical protein